MSERALTPTVVAVIVAQAPRLARAREIFADIQALETGMLQDRDRLLAHAWHLGRELTTMKEEVGHGKWLPFLEGHWPQLTQQNGVRYMTFFKDNPNHGNSGDLTFSTESIRKFMWGYIPAKERPQLAGDGPVAPVAHHLTVINHFSKWDRQLTIGLAGAKPPIDQMRRDFEPMIRRQAELLGKDWLLQVVAAAPAA
jgi:hypothetical protein